MGQYQMWLTWLLGVFGVLLLSNAVNASCTVSTTSMNFGNYDVFASTATTGTGFITLSCAPGANVTIGIGASTNSGGFYPRMLQNDSLADTLNYNLYTSATMIQVWGDGANGTITVNFTNVKKNNSPITIYGKIDPLQNVSIGSYSDQLVVTISY